MNTTQSMRSWGKFGFDGPAAPIYDDYYYQRNIPRHQEHPEIQQDFSDLCSKQVPIPPVFASSQRILPEHLMSRETALNRTIGSPPSLADAVGHKPSRAQNNDFERLYYIELNRSKALEEDLKCMKDILKKSGGEKDQLRSNYEEFIKKLEEEIRMLKTFEAKYVLSDNQRRKAEEELNRKVIEVRLLREQTDGASSSSLLEEMKNKIRRLNEEKLALLNSMDIYRTEINELSNRITYIQHSDNSERENLAKLMSQMKQRNVRLESELKEVFERPPEDPALLSELRQKTEALNLMSEELESLKGNFERELSNLKIELESQRRLAMSADKELEVLKTKPQQTVEKLVYTSRPCDECGKKDSTIKYLSDKLSNKDQVTRTVTSTNEFSTVSTREMPTVTYRTISPARTFHQERIVSQAPTVYKCLTAEPCRCTGLKTMVSTTCTCNCHCHTNSYISTETAQPIISLRSAMEINKPINSSVITRTTTYGQPVTSQLIMPTTTTSVYSPHPNANPITFSTNANVTTLRTSMTTTNAPSINTVTYRTMNEYSNPSENFQNGPKTYRINNDHPISMENYQYQEQPQNLTLIPNQPQSTRARPMSAQDNSAPQRFFKAQSPKSINVPMPPKSYDYDSKMNDDFTKRLELSQPATDILVPSRFTLNKESQTPRDEDVDQANSVNRDQSYDSLINGFNFKKDSTAFVGSYLNHSHGQGADNTSNIFKRNSIMTTETRDNNVFRGAFNEYN